MLFKFELIVEGESLERIEYDDVLDREEVCVALPWAQPRQILIDRLSVVYVCQVKLTHCIDT
jgi:hypothetical protein